MAEEPLRTGGSVDYRGTTRVLPVGVALATIMSSTSGCGPKRAHRTHSDTVAEEFEYLTERIDCDFPGNAWLTRKEAEQDLDELEWLLENRYSYLKRLGVDYKAALDSIRCRLGGGMNRGDLGLQLMKFIALFGDGHSCVSDPRLGRLCSGYLPFLVAPSRGGLVAFKTDRSGFVDDELGELPEGRFSRWHYFVVGLSDSPRRYYYDRPVVILMDTQNFSASDVFLGAFKGRRNVTLMEAPSGGGRYQSFRMWHSAIGIHLSSMASFRPNGKLYDGNGIEPDVIIEPVATDFVGRTDSILDAAIERIQAN